MRLYNTLTRTKETFVPMEPGTVRMYCCGPTVYNFSHIGNMRAYIFNDVLRRTLIMSGYALTHVMNVTDVGHLVSDGDEGEDKMETGAEREGMTVWEIARKYEDAFFSDSALLNIQRPDVVCRATEHVPEMIALVQRLVKNNHAYVTTDAVYFDTSTFPTYADFARLDLGGMVAGAGGRVTQLGDKRHPNDFALWFMNKPRHIMQWDSPWGSGYPGWHIECSAMSMKYLGETFDIHTGGIDHIPVHHTNEIAQSESATGHKFARYWLHNEFLIVDKSTESGDGGQASGKMSKSGEQFLTVPRLVERGFNPIAYRYLCLQAHYRSELRFSWDNLGAAQSGLRKVYSARPEADPLADNAAFATARLEALAALNDDLNTPQLTGILNHYNSHRLWMEFEPVMGLGILAAREGAAADTPPEVTELVTQRDTARKARDWAASDQIRDTLIEMGYDVGDSPTGTTVKRRTV